MNDTDIIKKVTAGTREFVHGKGRAIEARRNVSGNLFLVIGPIYGSAGDEGGITEAAAICDAVKEITER